MREKIKLATESIAKDLTSFLRQIIAIPSLSGKEEAVIDRMKQEMIDLGYDKVWTDPFGNLLGMIGKGERLIAFDGHCDTVDVGNPKNWQFDPFLGDMQNNIIYGRGASDQKGGLASAIYAGPVLKKIGVPENLSFLVVASVLEEDYEGACWEFILEEDNIRPDVVVMTEPTDLEIKIGQRGRLEFKVTTEGISCHGSAPERGENAIYKMAPIIKDIEALNHSLENPSVLGKGTIAVTNIFSTSPSLCAVADGATIHLDRRLSLGETLETARKEISQLKSVQAAGARIQIPEYSITSYTGLKYPVKAYFPMWLMEENHPLVVSARKAYKRQFSQNPITGVWTFSTNGVVTKGVYDIPTIGYGPGEERHAHSPNDQVSIAGLKKAVEFYTALAIELSG